MSETIQMRRTIRTSLRLCSSLFFTILVGFFISGCSPESDHRTVEKPLDPISILESAKVSTLKPNGDLAEMFAIGSDFTQLQREIKVKEIQGKIIEWRLPVYEVSRASVGYRIQTSSGFGGLGSVADPAQELVRTFVYITPRKEEDRRQIEAIKTGDWVAVKGVIADVTLRILEIRPAILAADAAVLTKAEMIAAAESRGNEARDWKVAMGTNTEEGYAVFLRAHADSDTAKYARIHMKRAKAEADAARQPLPDEATRRQWQVSADNATLAMVPGTTFKDCPGCPMMVIIPAGNYQMGEKGLSRYHGDWGSSGNGEVEEIRSDPVHVVVFAHPFAMGQTEITNRQWRSLMGVEPANSIEDGRECDDECPVRNASWEDVHKFIRRLNAKTGKSYRLPSEAEWEYACRGGKREKYCGSDKLDEVAWHGGNNNKYHAVALKKANMFGLYDMTGNVSEWVQDCTNGSYDGAPTNGGAWQSGDCEKRITRGGASNSSGTDLNPASRQPVDVYGGSGFRLARGFK